MLQGMRAAAKYIWWFVAATFLIGFVFYQQSGLSDRATARGNAVARVNGTTITGDDYLRAVRAQELDEQQRTGRTPDQDEERQIRQQVFDQMVNSVLLDQEYKRRGITVSDDEVREAAMEQPYPPIARSPEFQTEGKFDFQKYQRFLNSPLAKQQGVLVAIEEYFRDALMRAKLYEQIATRVYATDAELWRLWRDTHDSTRVTYVALAADLIPDSAAHVPEQAIADYFAKHQKQLSDIPGHAVLSIATLSRAVTAADTARAKARAEALRAEIQKGAKFDDVARRESADTVSAQQGGSLGAAPASRYVPAFAAAVRTLPIGVVSAPVLTPFGWHVIRVDARKGDTVTVHHILVPITQSDSAATVTDRRADSLASVGGQARPGAFDSIAKQLGVPTAHVTVTEGVAATLDGRSVPGASAWAFSGAKPGEIGELLDAGDAYYLVRLDSVTDGGKPTLDRVHDQLKALLVREKKLYLLMPKAESLAKAAAAAPSFEKGASSLGSVTMTTPMFARTGFVVGLGQGSEAIGAAFGLPIGKVSAPVRARTALVVERVDARHLADSAAWEKQKPLQRDQVQQRIREQLLQQYLENLRVNATILDNRKALEEANRQATS